MSTIICNKITLWEIYFRYLSLFVSVFSVSPILGALPVYFGPFLVGGWEPSLPAV